MTIQSYEKTIVNKSNEIDYTDLTIDKNVKLKLDFNPKENQLKLPIKLKKTGWLERINITINKKIIVKKRLLKKENILLNFPFHLYPHTISLNQMIQRFTSFLEIRENQLAMK